MAQAQTSVFKAHTYYPSPFGVYSKLRLVPQDPLAEDCQFGTLYVENGSNTLQLCVDDGVGIGKWAPVASPWAVSGNDIYNLNEGNVGIGTSTPINDLHVKLQDYPQNGVRIEGDSPRLVMVNTGVNDSSGIAGINNSPTWTIDHHLAAGNISSLRILQ